MPRFITSRPFHFREDWQLARKVADWYRQDPSFQARYPKVMAAHPGIVYFLDIDRYDYTRIRSFDTETLHAHKPGTVLIWSPVHGDKNSAAERAFPLEEVPKHGWIELRDAGPDARDIPVAHPDPKAGDVGMQLACICEPGTGAAEAATIPSTLGQLAGSCEAKSQFPNRIVTRASRPCVEALGRNCL